MHSKVTELVNWVKANFEVTQEEIDRVLATDNFKILLEHDEELNIVDMAKAFLDEIGIKNYSPSFLAYSLNFKTIDECGIFSQIEEHLRSTTSLDNDEINRLICYSSIYEKDIIREVSAYIPGDMLETFQDLIKANDVVYEEPENLPNCEEVLQDKVNRAIKLLKYGYSLSEEQVELLGSYSYIISDELEEETVGDCDKTIQKIRIKSTSGSPMKTILHEMLHGLGIAEEGLTELLAQKIYMRYYSLIRPVNSFNNVDMFFLSLSNRFEVGDYLSPDPYINWSYYDISTRYRELFIVLRKLNMENEIIDLVLSGINIGDALKINFGDIDCINVFIEATSKLQKDIYDNSYDDYNTTKQACDSALFDFSVEGQKNLELSSIRKNIKSISTDMTIEDFIKVGDNIFESIFGSKSEYVKEVINDNSKLYDIEIEELIYLQKQMSVFKSSIDIVVNKCKISPQILGHFLLKDYNLLRDKKFVVIENKDRLYRIENSQIEEDNKKSKKLNYLSRIHTDGKSVDLSVEEVEFEYLDSCEYCLGEVSSNSFEFLEEDEWCDAIRIGNMAIAPDMLTEEDFLGRIFDISTKLKDVPTFNKTQKRNKGMDR